MKSSEKWAVGPASEVAFRSWGFAFSFGAVFKWLIYRIGEKICTILKWMVVTMLHFEAKVMG